MGEERVCIDIHLTIWFDAPRLEEARRRFERTVRICEGDDIDDVAEQLAREMGEAWARAMRVREREKVDAYIDGVYEYIRHYLYNAVGELYERLEELRERCRRYPSDVVYEEGSDGYYEEAENRGFYVQASTTFVCREIDVQIRVVESLLETPYRRRDIVESMFEKLDPCQRRVVEPLLTGHAPHEDVLNWLEMWCGARWWYTVYYTSSR